MSSIKNVAPSLMRWTFDADEVSAGVYRVRGADEMGRSVEAIGTDPDALLEQCKKSVNLITATTDASSAEK